jgi:CheY-like chemotaxis protein
MLPYRTSGPNTRGRIEHCNYRFQRNRSPWTGIASGSPRCLATTLRTLIIEDNVDLAATYQTLLQRRGHHVTVVHTGHDGLAVAHQQRFDLVLCDLGLPDITGYEVAQRLRADPSARPGRLVAHSGYSQNADHQQSLQAGFDAHLTKPMAISDLEHILDEPGAAEPPDPT